MAEVRLVNVSKSYAGEDFAVREVRAEIAAGAFVVIVGPSGCGKSTLLRLIAGLEAVSSGEIEIAGEVVNRLEPAQRDVAMVFQNYALYPHMTVRQNMAYGLKIRKLAKDEIRARVEATAATLGIVDLLDRKPGVLSGGQRQRVAMGRCIVREPRVFLFDEPLSNLDAKLRTRMRLELKKLHKRLKTTSIYVTHDQVEAMTLGEKLIVMNQGRVEQVGAPLALYQRPATRFVAGFLGSPSMNFLPAALSGDGRAVELPVGQRLTLDEAGVMGEGGRSVLLGVRPEDLVLGGEGASLHFRVEMVEVLGADTLVHGGLQGVEESWTLRLPVGDLPEGAESDGELALAVKPGGIHLFDPQSGRRLGE
ncbi:MAG: sn-glycerol-3-phosphate ABC transporter ATP-binding protein UgpC [Magnetococcales bacterium]|nr:sn-glycerol-3-phosphate ABC transporter ATP-binding protein UgpC [Magnetococcales bacterium]